MAQHASFLATKKAVSLDSGIGLGESDRARPSLQRGVDGELCGVGRQVGPPVDANRSVSVDGASTDRLKRSSRPGQRQCSPSAGYCSASTTSSTDSELYIPEETTMPASLLISPDDLTTVSRGTMGHNETDDGGGVHGIPDLGAVRLRMRTTLPESGSRDRRSKMLDTQPVLMRGREEDTGGGRTEMQDAGSTKAVFRMRYHGNVALDRRVTQPMLPWILADKRRRARGNSSAGQSIFLQVSSRAAVGISETRGSIVFEHLPQSITRFSRGHDRRCFAYLWRPDSDSNFQCYVFEASEPDVVQQVASAVREASKEAVKYDLVSREEKAGVEAIENLRINNATMFEVLYCGRVTVSHKRAPPSLIDDTIEMFNAHEAATKRKQLASTRKRHFSCGDQNSAGLSTPTSQLSGELVSPVVGTTTPTMAMDSDRLSSGNSSSVSSDSLASSSSPCVPEADTDLLASRSSGLKDRSNLLLAPVARDRVASAGAAMLKRRQAQREEDAAAAVGMATISSGTPSPTTPTETADVTSGHNRTMLFQIGKSMLTLISPDKKSFMLTKKFNDISFCSQGIKQPEFFGFICREKTSSSNYMCYVFKCQSEPVVDGIMTTLRQSFNVALQKSKLHVICGTCPMHQLHKLCQTIEGQTPEKAHTVLLKQLDTLTDVERISVIAKTKESKAGSAQEANEIIMGQLIAICEQQQNAHTHNSDVEGGDMAGGSPLQERKVAVKGNGQEPPEGKVGAFKKAKKSLASSFENLLSRKKKTSVDEQNSLSDGYRSRQGTLESLNSETSSKSSPRDSPVCLPKASQTAQPNSAVTASTPPPKHPHPHAADIPTPPNSQERPGPAQNANGPSRPRPSPSPIVCKQDSLPESTLMSPTVRPRSKTLGDTPSPSPKTPPPDSRFQYMHTANLTPQSCQKPAQTRKLTLGRTISNIYDDRPSTLTLSPFSPHPSGSSRRMSWRQQIFNRVVTPIAESKLGQMDMTEEESEEVFEGEGSPAVRGLERGDSLSRPRRFNSRQEIRDLWKKAVREQILLIRMDKENKNLQARQDAAQEKRIKLDYEEITPCLKEVTIIWERILGQPNRSNVRLSREEINDTFRQGIPKGRRGEIWQLISEQQKLNGITNSNVADHMPYKELLKELTIHQHAILIDLGRTFPTHPYFANPLGRGQLSLFNLLKAYSLLDTDVGYCQGLSFVAGVLLMHMDETQSFDMLVYLMYSLGFRRQYKPDMIALQIQMYQLSRLLHDFHKRLYDHLEQNEISPSLYAAPWFLTLFASQFPLGFVAKVFDLIFLQGFEVIFKVALIVLGSHEELLLQCDGFEAIIEFLKDTLPTLGIIQMENVINKAYQLDISKELHAYEVEYHMLQEEMAPSPVHRRTTQPAADVHKLETANRNLRRHNSELLEQLQTAHNMIHSQEAMVHNLRKNEDKLKSEVRALNLERSALLNTVAKLRSLLPKGLPLEEAGINFTTPTPTASLSSSTSTAPFFPSSGGSFDDKDASPLDQRADSGTGNLSGSQTCSLDEDLDTEVASLTTPSGHAHAPPGCPAQHSGDGEANRIASSGDGHGNSRKGGAWGRVHSDGSSGSEISTSTSSDMDGLTFDLSCSGSH